MIAYVFRHGKCKYEQGKTSVALADDLTDDGVRDVTFSALDLGEEFSDELGGVEIWTSPFGRCGHSAKIIHRALAEKGIKLGDIQVVDELSEVENLTPDVWKIFQAFARGGEIHYDGQDITINREESNPLGDSPTEYFRTDTIHNLLLEFQATLPSGLVKKIASVETSKSVGERFNRFLSQLKDDSIIVTHEGHTGSYIEKAVGSMVRTPYLQRGKYFILDGSDDIWTPTDVQEGAAGFDNGN